MHWALREPDRFRAVITLSGAVGSRIPTGYSLRDIGELSDLARLKELDREKYTVRTEFAMTYGSVEQYLENDDAHLIRQMQAALKAGKSCRTSIWPAARRIFSMMPMPSCMSSSPPSA